MKEFEESSNHPDWMIMSILPVIPPDLRPLVPLEGGRFAASDLNDLYRRIINRNNRLKHIEALRAPEVMIYNEKRLLQEAVDALIENGARGKFFIGAGGRPLKSLSDVIKGKHGRFRQNLLGKRVDYSGRSVIVVGPSLKLHQCGLPKLMALELFKPFIIGELMQRQGITLKAAKKMLERVRPEVWDILEYVTKNHPVLLNRAPTLHRLGIQAFEPVLIEGKAIQLHPLTCAAFNADFDGDQMAVHVPLSLEAQLEARMLMMATNNILSPASGRPIVAPSHDIVLGINYLTKAKTNEKGEGGIYSDQYHAYGAYQQGKLSLHAKIKIRGINQIMEEGMSRKDLRNLQVWKDYTTVGRVIFNNELPKNWKFVNKNVDKKELSYIVETSYKDKRYTGSETVKLLDGIMKLGYDTATKSGLSISIMDMTIPEIKQRFIAEAKKQVLSIQKQAEAGIITEGERYNKVVDIWTRVSDQIADRLFEEMRKVEDAPHKGSTPRFNSIFLMSSSGARGSRQQVRQLAGMRGLMARPQKKLTGGIGEIIESPVLSNFREGLSVLEYFISTHGGRKGLSDTALKTADAGYLTRRLVDVGHNLVINEIDCGTINGITAKSLMSGEEIIEPLKERVVGRISLETIAVRGKDKKEKIVIKEGELITPKMAEEIYKHGVESLRIRSVLTCEAEIGICAKCYGINLATWELVNIGEAVGIIAAQSIGEPGTQLTLRTFHIGGTASRILSRSQAHSDMAGKVAYKDINLIKNRVGNKICISRNGALEVSSSKGVREHKIHYGAIVYVEEGARVAAGKILAEWDPHSLPIIAETEGSIHFHDVAEGITLHEERNKVTGVIERRIIGSRESKKNPRAVITRKNKKINYPLPLDTILLIESGDKVKQGDVIAKIPQEVTATKDITGGLPRVAELFEARKPKKPAVVSGIDGIVGLETSPKGLIEVSVRNEETGQVKQYSIPHGKHLVVYEGDKVSVGEALTDGAVNPHDVLHVKGIKEAQEFLLNAIQEVYRLQGVIINDRHIEITVRQMLNNIKILDSGDSTFLKGEIVSKALFRKLNKKIAAEGRQQAQGETILLGISKASLASESFISAASFQETTKVLTDAAITGQTDYLKGLKENVIVGHLIPARTGLASKKLNSELLKTQS
jgi:DNA-directed RNA polymerase subunit beta'